jgi:hypothetical protein
MSTVTNIILHTDMEPAGLQIIQKFFEDLNVNGLEESMIDSGGGKRMEIDLYTGAYNGFGNNADKLAELFYTIEWLEPHRVVLIITPQDGLTLIHRPNNSR